MSDGEAKDPGHEPALAAAYEERTKQLHEARGALAEAVAALSVELGQRRAEAEALRNERDRAVADARILRDDADALRKDVAQLSQVISAFQNMKVIRWSAPVRGIVYRLRARGK